MIAQVENTIILYEKMEIYEDEGNDNMKLYKETSVGTYVVSQKVIKDNIRNFSKSKIMKKYQHPCSHQHLCQHQRLHSRKDEHLCHHNCSRYG